MANFTSTHTGSVVDAAVTKITATSSSATELNILDGVTATTAELNILDGVTATTAEINILDGVTATAAEINILDGVTSTAAELNILDGVTSTAAELNVLDGYTGSVTELNYLDTLHATGVTSTEFDYLDGVTSNIQTQLDAKIEATLTSEQVQDIVGAMFSSNTESGITVSYEDGDGTIDLTVATQSDNNFTTTLLNKLNAIEASADVTDTANVTSAGALMDSEVSNLSFVKGLTKGISDGNVLTANDAVADNDFLRIDGTEVEGRTAAEVRSDLNVEDGATADQTASEIKTLVGNASDSNVFTDADHSKLDGIEASADVTDATNVTSAGALMDSELTSIADVKALDQSVVSGATPTFTTTNFTDASNKRLMTDAQETKLDSVESNATADQTDEEIQDVVGAMFSSNTETGITATYQDGDGTIDLVVGTLNQDTTGTAAKVTVSDSTANTNFPVVFHDESNALLDDTGALRYNPSTGELLVPKLTVAGTTTQVDTVTMEAANAIIFEGATADAHETTLSIVDPTADHTQYLINQGGYIPVLAAATTTAITSTPAELNVLDGITSTTAELNILDGVTATAAELNIMDGVTATTAELNYTDGVTSNIQTQLDATLDTAGTGIDISSTTISVDVSDFMSNGASGRILRATGADAMSALTNITSDGTDLAIAATGKIYLDGGSDTYISETSADELKIFVGGQEMMKFTEGADDRITIGSTSHLKIQDGKALIAGDSDDLVIQHSAGHSYIDNHTGDLIIQNDATDKDVILKSDDGSDGMTAYITLDGSSGYTKAHKHILYEDSVKAMFGTGGDLAIQHDGSNSYISHNVTGDLYIENTTSDEDIFIRVNDGGSTITALQIDSSDAGTALFNHDIKMVDSAQLMLGDGLDFRLQHDGSNNYITASTSDQDIYIRVNDGGSTITAIQIDASEVGKVRLPNDGQTLSLGAGNDLTFQHDGSNSYIGNGVGNLYISNDTDDGDIIFRSDDGSGGVTTYMRFDGSDGYTVAEKRIRFNDNVLASFGSSQDAYIYHDGTNTNIVNETGDLYIQNLADDKDIILRSDDGSGGVTAYLTLDGSATTINVAKNMDFADDVRARFGNSGDLQIVHSGGINYIHSAISDIDLMLRVNDGGSNINAVQIDASEAGSVFMPNDNATLGIGAGNDLRLFHDGTNSYIYNYQGELRIGNTVDDADTVFYGDDGSGGNTAYITLDGGLGYNTVQKHMRFDDAAQLYLGTGADLQIYHDGTNSFINNLTGDLTIKTTASNEDMIFSVNDGGSQINAIYIDSSNNGMVKLQNDLQYLTFGSGDDGVLYSYEDNFYVSNHTAGKDTIFTNLNSDSSSHVEIMRLDGSTSRVGIGTTSPEGKLHIYQSDAGVAPHGDGDDLVLESNADTGISILSGEADGETGAIIFGSQNDSFGAALQYNYYENRLKLYTANSGHSLQFATDNNTLAMTIDSQRNLKFEDNGTNPSAAANTAFLFNDSGELKVLDELGNTTTISPHNFELIPNGASEDMAFAYHSTRHTPEGKLKKVNVDMMKLARLVEKLTGEKLVYTEET